MFIDIGFQQIAPLERNVPEVNPQNISLLPGLYFCPLPLLYTFGSYGAEVLLAGWIWS
jgi:hypothetical protein